MARTFYNRYVIMRHGQSEANVAKTIVSNPATGISSYGLTEEGRRQVLQSLAENQYRLAGARILCSDFLRTRETAELVHAQLESVHPIQQEERLRERSFGNLEGRADSCYKQVWELDAGQPDHESFNVESVDAVLRRAVSLLESLESRFRDETIVLVAHGDVL